MKDYETLIPTSTAEEIRCLVLEAAGDAGLSFRDFGRIVRDAERRLDDLAVEGSGSGVSPDGFCGADTAAFSPPVSKCKGWPDCAHCELFRPLSMKCGSVNADGLSPCEVMSLKMYKYVRRET